MWAIIDKLFFCNHLSHLKLVQLSSFKEESQLRVKKLNIRIYWFKARSSPGHKASRSWSIIVSRFQLLQQNQPTHNQRVSQWKNSLKFLFTSAGFFSMFLVLYSLYNEECLRINCTNLNICMILSLCCFMYLHNLQAY